MSGGRVRGKGFISFLFLFQISGQGNYIQEAGPSLNSYDILLKYAFFVCPISC